LYLKIGYDKLASNSGNERNIREETKMPYIAAKVNVKLTPQKEEVLKQRFGKAIELIPGKSERALMIGFEDECRLWFRGKKETGIAFIEVKILGKSTGEAYNALTAELTKILGEELGIAPDQIYVKFEEIDHWGSRGACK
jgi:phenylpyruvate tautomerase PptA (4-oxalocrotonate tautomerase family)